MGDLFSAFGQSVKARDAYQKDLDIAACLAAAEPDRADYEVDLAISLARTGSLDQHGGRAMLERALSVLQVLQSKGRLAPADEPRIDALRRMLADR